MIHIRPRDAVILTTVILFLLHAMRGMTLLAADVTGDHGAHHRLAQICINVSDLLQGHLGRTPISMGQLRCGQTYSFFLRICNDTQAVVDIASMSGSCQCTSLAFEPSPIPQGQSVECAVTWETPFWSAQARIDLTCDFRGTGIRKISLMASLADLLQTPPDGRLVNFGKINRLDAVEERRIALKRGAYRSDWDTITAAANSGLIRARTVKEGDAWFLMVGIDRSSSSTIGWFSAPLVLDFHAKGVIASAPIVFRVSGQIADQEKCSFRPSSLYFGTLGGGDAVAVKTFTLSGIRSINKSSVRLFCDDAAITAAEPLLIPTWSVAADGVTMQVTVKENGGAPKQFVNELRVRTYRVMFHQFLLSCTFADGTEGEVGLPVFFSLPAL